MSKVRLDIAVSLDGFAAGPNQSLENPLGEGGEGLHTWAFELEFFRRMHEMEGGDDGPSNAVMEEAYENLGATVMGRNMFGGGPGPWGDEPWQGWWGDNPPFHRPVFVVTHFPREPLVLSDTTFYFVTDGVASAVNQAKEAAAGKDVLVSGGADVAQQCLAADFVDEMQIHIAPVTLGGGERLLANLGDEPPKFEVVRAVDAPGVTHIKYRVTSR
jgi:dihydrofolate reductase